MKNRTCTHALAAALLLGASATWAQTAGSASVVATTEIKAVLEGWSVKKQFIGANVFNEEQKKVGKIEDVIIAPDGTLSYAIVGAGGFVGLGRHDVAVPISKFQTSDNRIVLPGATKDMIKALPEFKYEPKMERML